MSNTTLDDVRLTLTPAALLSIAGVLVDSTFIGDAFRERIWAQVVLWLAASLQSPSDGIPFVLIHGMFFLSVCSAGYRAFLVQRQWSISDDALKAEYSRFLAPSMILPLLYSWLWRPLETSQTVVLACNVLFSLTLLVLCAWRWARLRRWRLRQEHVGMPTVESIPMFHTTSSKPIEERLWMDWTPSQVLEWIHGFEGDWTDVCCRLASERIPGSVLDAVTVSALREMGIPYGTALLLVDRVQNLTDRYPSTSQRRKERYRHEDSYEEDIELDQWIGRDASQFSERIAADDGREAPAHPLPVSIDAGLPGELNYEAIHHAKTLFREQFGLELPEIKTTPVSDQEQTQEDGVPPIYYKQRMPTSSTAVSAAPASFEDALPRDVLKGMPPHVHHVAEQQPDLTRLLWAERQTGRRGMNTIHQLRMQDPAYAQRFAGAQVAADITEIPVAHASGENDSDTEAIEQISDGERTSLLRKRAGRASKYASIR